MLAFSIVAHCCRTAAPVVRILMIAFVAVAARAGSVAAEDSSTNWPQWRGPQGTGLARTGSPPVEWSETKNVKWKVRVPGDGMSTPIIWGERIFVQSAIPTGKKEGAAATKSEVSSDNPARGQTPSTSTRLLDRLDVNKDGKISRAELPEGPLRNFFDRLVETYRLDGSKTYTLQELKRLVSDTTGDEPSRPANDPTSAQNPSSPGQGQRGQEKNQPPRRPGGGGPGGQGGPGGMRSVKPTEVFQFVLMCLDRQTGNLLWQRVACEEVPHEGHHDSSSFATSSPITDGKHVFAYFGSRGLYCYDMDGTLVWKKDLGDMRIAMGFGEGSSPVLAGNSIIINWDHEGESFIVALDKATGSTLWRKPRDERTSWATPLLVEHEGKLQVVTAATRKVRSYDAASGELIWECAGLGPNTIPSPVAGDGMVFAMSGFRQFSLLAIRLGGTGDLSGTDSVAWRLDRGTPYVPSPLLYDDKLYFCAGNKAVLSCIDARSGKAIAEQQRVDGLQDVYASPVGVAGHIYLVGRNGVTAVLKNGDKPTVIATNRLDDPIDASPAIAGNELYLRGRSYLYCIASE